ncbi:hypothetical protein AALA21_01060 [Eggerthellaceae bacterium 3-80]|nr:hypothetical protein D7W09_01250 [bacterium D16-34]
MENTDYICDDKTDYIDGLARSVVRCSKRYGEIPDRNFLKKLYSFETAQEFEEVFDAMQKTINSEGSEDS